MSFNELRRNLEDSASREARIRELAENLQRRGLAMTKESARQLAISMVETERKVQRRYQERKEQATSYNDPRSKSREGGETRQGATRGFLHTSPAKREEQEPVDPSPHVEYPELKPSMTAAEAAAGPVQEGPAAPEEEEQEEEQKVAPESSESSSMGSSSAENSAETSEPDEYPVLGAAEDHAAEPGDEELGSEAESETPVEEADEHADEAEPAVADEGAGGYVELAGEASVAAESPGAEKESEKESREEESGEEESVGEEPAESASDAQSSEAVSETEQPQREDLGKKHGIDLANIFNVNK